MTKYQGNEIIWSSEIKEPLRPPSLDTILQFLKAAFELLAKLFDPDSASEGPGNRKKSVVAARKYARLLLAFLALGYMASVVPLLFWGTIQSKEIARLENKIKLQEAEVAKEKKRADEQKEFGYSKAWWELIRHEALACSETFSGDLTDIQNDPDWPMPDGTASKKTLESIQTHLLSLEKNLVAANKYHQWLDVRLPGTSQDLHKPILKALDSFRGKLMLRKGQVNGTMNLTLFKDDVCKMVEELIEEVKRAIEKGDKSLCKN